MKDFQIQKRGVILIHLSSEEIVTQYGDMVYRIALAAVKQKEDAQDVFQDVFLSLVRHLADIQSEEHLKYWLIRATINRAKNLHASFWHRNTTSFVVWAAAEPAVPEVEDTVNDLREAVCTLPHALKVVVVLYYYEGYSTKEIAAILQIKEGTVKSRLHTARARLKIKLEA